MDWRWLGARRWSRWDTVMVALLSLAGLLAVLSVAVWPELRKAYPSLAASGWSEKGGLFAGGLLWIVSWLPGWEFLHRYVLLREASAIWPRRGWLLVPLSEFLYHLQKAVPEAVGMLLLSILLTRWTLSRRNQLPAFVIHALIETSLLVFLLVV